MIQNELFGDQQEILTSMYYLNENDPLDKPRYDYLNGLLEKVNAQIKPYRSSYVETTIQGVTTRHRV